jgi:hypothetical protein
VLVYRLQVGIHLGRYTTLGLYGEFGSISAGDACGTDLAGAQPESTDDFGPHNRFNSCRLYMGGAALDVRFARRGSRFQPWVSFAPGLRDTAVAYTPVAVSDMSAARVSGNWLSIVASVRAGVDLQPRRWPAYLTIGGFIDGEITVAGQEQPDDSLTNYVSLATYVTLLVGVRSTWEF